MARGKGSSSDKLLEMIRGKKGGKAEAGVEAGAPKAGGGAAAKKAASGKAGNVKNKSTKIRTGYSFGGGGGKALVVGVDLGPDSLRLSKMSGPPTKRKLLAFKRVPYDPSAPPGSSGFIGFLRDRLREFCKSPGQVEIWALISSAKAELWNINIPRVSKKQVVDAVYWSVKKEKQFDESEFILDFEVIGETAEKGVPKLAVTVYLAPRKQVEEMTSMFAKAGYKLHGVTIAPIAIQTLFRSNWVQTNAGTYANLYVGRNWSRIDIFSKGNLVLSRGIKAGTNSMVESLMESYNMGQGRQVFTETISQSEPIISMSMDDEESIVLDASGTIRQSASIDMEQAKRLLTGKLLGGAKVHQGSPGAELAEQEIVELILPAVERLVRQIERTFEYHTTTMGNEPVEQIFFSGAICTNKLIVQYMYSQLGIESRMLDPLHPDNSSLGRIEVPESIAERMEYNLVVALALSDNSFTPNLLYTFRDKERARSALAVDKAIYAVTILILAVLFGVYMWQQDTINDTRGQKSLFEQQMKAYEPRATKDSLTALAAQVSALHMQLKKASLRYESLTLMSEISAITPDYVKLLSVDIDLGQYVEPVSAAPEDPQRRGRATPSAPAKESGKLMVLSGFIQGQDVDKFESAFVSYLIRLENSQLFSMPEIHKQDNEEFPGRGTVLRFIVHIKVKAG